MIIEFATPAWLWALFALIPLALLRLRSYYKSKKGAKGLVAPRLRQNLIIGADPILGWARFGLQMLALAALIVTLARPRWGFEEVATESSGRNVLIAIDTSRSMLANDLIPNRLSRAKIAARDIVHSLPEDRISVIAFAGRAFLQAPLTMDHDAVEETIQQLDTDIITRGGTNLTSPLRLAVDTMIHEDETAESALIVFSDGEDLEGGEDLNTLGDVVKKLNMLIVTIGVGTETGTIIPDPTTKNQGAFIQDDSGRVVRSRLDSTALRRLSALSHNGLYLNLGATESVPEVVRRALAQIEESQREGRMARRPVERFVIPLGLAGVLLAAAFLLPATLRPYRGIFRWRPGTKPSLTTTSAALVAILSLSMPWPVHASMGDDLAALSAYESDEFKVAIDRYQEAMTKERSPRKMAWLQFGLGSAAYRLGDYEMAKEAFGQALLSDNQRIEEQAHYNLGNTLFRHGETVLATDPGQTLRQWYAALDHYEAVLALNDGNKLVRHNIEVVKSRIKYLESQQEPQDQPQDQNQDPQEDPPKEEEKEDEPEEDQEEEKEEDKEDEQQDQNQQDPEGDQNQDQNQDQSEDQNQPQSPPPGQDQEKDQDPGKDPPPQGDPNQDPSGGQKPPGQEPESNPEDKPQDGQDQDQSPPQGEQPPPEGDQKDQGPPPQGGDKPEDGKPRQNDGKDEQKPQEQPPGSKPPGQQQQPQSPQSPPPEGDLKSDRGQAQPSNSTPGQQAEGKEGEEGRDPNSGFTPSEARQLLRALSDEEMDVRIPLGVREDEVYRNW